MIFDFSLKFDEFCVVYCEFSIFRAFPLSSRNQFHNQDEKRKPAVYIRKIPGDEGRFIRFLFNQEKGTGFIFAFFTITMQYSISNPNLMHFKWYIVMF